MPEKYCYESKQESFHYLHFLYARGLMPWQVRVLLFINGTTCVTRPAGCSHPSCIPSTSTSLRGTPELLLLHAGLRHASHHTTTIPKITFYNTRFKKFRSEQGNTYPYVQQHQLTHVCSHADTHYFRGIHHLQTPLQDPQFPACLDSCSARGA